MKIIVNHPTSNNFSRSLIKALFERKYLDRFYTSIACFDGDFIERMGKLKLLSELHRRLFDSYLRPHVYSSPYYETGRIISLKLGLSNFVKHEKGIFSIDSVYRHLDLHVASDLEKCAINGTDAIYCYEDGAINSFLKAKEIGIKCIYDLPIAYWELRQKLMLEESVRLPIWGMTLGGGAIDSKEKLEKKTKEFELADIIVVPSKFVQDSLPKTISRKKIIMSPFGSPAVELDNEDEKRKININRPLRVLFAGSMGQRKGLGDLFEAMKLIHSSNVQLIVMGSLQTQMKFYREQYSHFIYESGRPNKEVLALMRTCDVFCLPSIAEGRALVMQEAMSQGLPLIITANTGGEDLIIEGKTGFLVPIRSPEKIAEKIIWFNENRQELFEMSLYAKKHAMLYTWEKYANTIVSTLGNWV